ncbi:hypothetical protein BCR37DRAFT_103999 [Protomyces lactucae-debilis]|uniref:Uncharacterized protein n=1 Tax=Protomyces lactucae-debilis TaxID=2754530 RepID=A0A1Y2F5F7_PROLT|nr:uncharacterized protein BCR37DRAFT_103999 [Protomyces lactucae-debilis]ORY79093.1 hypothetical protein BCR37DRAFT_103999 [Protomyces lactucae-debilis]
MHEQEWSIQALAMLQLDQPAKTLTHVGRPVLWVQGDTLAVLRESPCLALDQQQQASVRSMKQRFDGSVCALPKVNLDEALVVCSNEQEARICVSTHQEQSLQLLILDSSSDETPKPLICLFFPLGALSQQRCDALKPFNQNARDPQAIKHGTDRYSLRRLKRFLLGFEWFLDLAQRPKHLHCRDHIPSWLESGAEGIFRGEHQGAAKSTVQQQKQDKSQLERLQNVVRHLGMEKSSRESSTPVVYAPQRAGGWRTRATILPVHKKGEREVSGASSEDWQGEGSIAARILQGVGMRPLPDLRHLFRP